MTARTRLEGSRIGYLHVIAYEGYRSGGSYYHCRCCGCGQKCSVSRRNLRGGTRSCGCVRRSLARARLTRMQAGWRAWRWKTQGIVGVPVPVVAPRRYGTRPLRFSY